MSYSDAKIKRVIKTGGGLGVKRTKSRKKGKGVLGMLAHPKKLTGGKMIKSYFV